MPSSLRRRPSLADFELATAAVPPVDDRLVHSLPIASIQPSPRNPRQQLTGIDELAASLQAHGLVQPIVVRRAADGYQLVAGHRRLQAARALGWSEIQAVIRGESEDDAYILTLIENLQRQDLTAAEEAEALGVLIRERNWSVRRVAEAIKRDPLYVSRRLRVFEDPVLRQPVLEQRLPVSTAEVLLRVDPERRAELVAETIANGWGQMEIRRTLRAGCGVTPHPDTSGVGSQRRSEDLVRLLREATQLLDAGPVTELTAAAHSELRAFYQRLSLLERTCTSSASTRG